MIKTVYLENYKCFGPEGVSFELKPLTFLYGTNGVGKSTFLQALAQLQDWETRKRRGDTYPSIKDILFKKDPSLTMGISVTLESKQGELKLFKRAKLSGNQTEIIEDTIDTELEASAKEEVIKRFLALKHQEASRPIDTRHATSSMEDFESLSTESYEQTSALLAEIGLGDFSFINKQTLKDNVMGIEIPWKNTGAGIHHLAFTLESIASLKPDGILMLEEPETHVDPRYLGNFTKVIVDALQRNDGAQLIVECHSEHMMLAIKGLIRQESLDANDVTAIYLQRNNAGTMITRIPFDEQGRFIQEWPEGGFYQERWDLITMGAE